LQGILRQRKAWISRAFAVTLVAAFALLNGAAPAPAQPAPVSVYPLPGTNSALPQTQITFRGIPANEIGSVQVVGSSTGTHSGTIQADSDGDGGSFIPSQPFAPGETVTVNTGLNIVNGSGGSFHFTIATSFGTINPMKLPLVPVGVNGVQYFHTRPDLVPASITVNRRSGAAYNSDIFLTPQYGPLQNGPMILDPNGNLIWFQPLPPNQLATDLRVQQLGGQPVLTWWQGYTNNGSGRGEGVIYNSAYQQIATVQAANGLQGMDLHEFLVTPQGDAYIVGVSPIHYGTLTKPLMDAVVQEIDIKTGLVLFEWHAIDHIPITASYFNTNSKGYVYDPYHLNSISLDSDGNLIVSMRNTWGVYKINRSTGAVMWTLGSNQSSFKLGPGTATAFQHDAVVQPDGSITIFDDGGAPPHVHSQSRAIHVSLNTSNNTATLLQQFDHSPAISANFEGNAQPLPNGDTFVGWGQQPYFSEFNANGQEIFDARFTSNTSSYRAYRMGWTGQPNTPPSIAAAANNDATSDVWASWNGATTVASWQVLAGPSTRSLTQFMTVGKGGFETGIIASSGEPVFEVQALGSGGQVLATSGPASVAPHIGIAGRSAFVSGTGVGGLPALCANSRTCHIAVTITAGGSVIARTGPEQVPAQGGGLIYFALNGAGRSLLAHARGHRLLVNMTGRDVSKLTFSRYITLVPFSTSGSAPARTDSQASSLRLLGLTDFVSTNGVGGILAECLANAPCHTKTTLTVGNTVVASTGSELLGPRGIGYLIFTLTSAGRSMLGHARGNQLGAGVTISDAGATARGQVVLVRFR
jgi:hypothetical protein